MKFKKVNRWQLSANISNILESNIHFTLWLVEGYCLNNMLLFSNKVLKWNFTTKLKWSLLLKLLNMSLKKRSQYLQMCSWRRMCTRKQKRRTRQGCKWWDRWCKFCELSCTSQNATIKNAIMVDIHKLIIY